MHVNNFSHSFRDMTTPTGGFDWEKCVLCQRPSHNVKLNCPADSKRTDLGSGIANIIDGYVNLEIRDKQGV